jgi:hypothetical protein
MKTFLIISTFLFLSYSFASGTISLEGKVRGFSKETLDISDGHHIYIILKDKLAESQQKQFAHVKTGETVKLQVSFDAIKSTNPVIK